MLFNSFCGILINDISHECQVIVPKQRVDLKMNGLMLQEIEFDRDYCFVNEYFMYNIFSSLIFIYSVNSFY